MTDVEELVKQCMASGFFKSEENARRFIMENCIPKPEPKYNPEQDEEVFTDNLINTCDTSDLE